MEQALHGLLSLNPDISSEIMSTVMKQKSEESQDSKKLSQKSDSPPPIDLSPPSSDGLPVGSVCHSPRNNALSFGNPMLFSLGQDMISSAMYYGAPLQGSSSPINLVKAERREERSLIHDPLMSPDAIRSYRNRSSVDSALSHRSSYDNDDLESMDAVSRKTSYDFSDEEIQALNARNLHNTLAFDSSNFQQLVNNGSNSFRKPQYQSTGHRPDNRPPSLEVNSRPSSVASHRASPYLSRSHNPSPFHDNKSHTFSSPSPYHMAHDQSTFYRDEAMRLRQEGPHKGEAVRPRQDQIIEGDMSFSSDTVRPRQERDITYSTEAVRPMSRQERGADGDTTRTNDSIIDKRLSSRLDGDTERSTSRQGRPFVSEGDERSLSRPLISESATAVDAGRLSRQGRPSISEDEHDDRRKVMKLSIDKVIKPKETAIVSPTVKVEDETQLSVAYLTYKVHQSFQTNFRSRADIQAMQEKVAEFKHNTIMGKQDMHLMFHVSIVT